MLAVSALSQYVSLVNVWQSASRSVKVEQRKSYVQSQSNKKGISDDDAELMNYLHYLQFVMLQCELHLL